MAQVGTGDSGGGVGGTAPVAANPVPTDLVPTAPAASGEGYTVPIRLHANWPGLPGSTTGAKAPGGGQTGTGIHYDAQAMIALAAQVRAKKAELVAVLDHVAAAGTAKFGPSTWPEGVALQSATDLVSSTIKSYSAAVQQNLEELAQAIEGSAHGMATTESSATSTVNSVSSAISPSGTAAK
jgi:hypothetical protein